MARSFFVLMLICMTALVKGQFDAQFSQNMFNQLATNPGFAGSSGMINLTTLNRQQWVGFEGAPKTTVFGADAAINLFKSEGGVGLMFMNDEIGPFKNIIINMSYAYRIEMENASLGLGLSVGMINQTLDGTTLDPLSGTDGNTYHSTDDPAIPQNKVTDNALDVGFGAFYESTKYYVGFSVNHLNKPSPDFDGEFQTYFKQTVFINGGYRYKMKKHPVVLVPSLYVKTDFAALQVDVNMNAYIKDKYWAGLTYRHQDAIVILAGIELLNGLKLGYSYDITLSKLFNYSSGSHEIMLGYSFDLSFEKRTKRYKSVRYL
ncbi:MAG: type IX secretion system membrane protein PorP/SprF [Chlorobi bacterium]|nr:type IX secretion system membrane protein PorP/SprF [Chlorobiota bacterium]